MTSISTPIQPVKPQSVCIDLPGEAIKCWRSTDKVQVILRKHRDVIFDLRSAPGRKYTVESTGADFYHADKKKLIAGQGKQRVLFNDGERLHLWVARDFTGELLLKSDGRVMTKVTPLSLDGRQYDGFPSTKPAPIIISVSEPQLMQSRSKSQIGTLTEASSGKNRRPVAAPIDEDCPVVCVIKGTIKNAPAAVRKAIENGGGKSGLADIDFFEVATRNWILGQLIGAGAYVGDNWDWLRASLDEKTHKGFKLVKASIHYVRGEAKFYFSGYSKYNLVFGPGGFGSGHDRILSIFGGAGKVSTVVTSAAKGVLGTFRNNALIAFVFGTVTSFVEWKEDASKDGYDLFASVLTSAVKAILVAVIVAPIVAGILALIMFASEASVAVVAVGGLCLGVGVIVTFGVDTVDRKIGEIIGGKDNKDGISGILADRIRNNVKGNWDYLKKKFLWEYEEMPL